MSTHYPETKTEINKIQQRPTLNANARRYPPGPKRRFSAGLFFEIQRDPLKLIADAIHEYGDLVHFQLGPQHIYLVNQPAVIQDILVTHNKSFIKSRGLRQAKRILGEGLLTSEGDFHLRQRRLAQPAFHRQRLAGYAEAMSAYAARTRERWRDGAVVDIHQEMMRLTLDIVAKTLFDADVKAEAQDIREALNTFMSMFNRLNSPLAEWLDRLPLASNKRFWDARARLDAIIYRIINERRSSGQDRGDLLSMLLHAQDVEGDNTRMTDMQLRDEAVTIFLAGHETTANALTWTWYLLSQNPAIEEKLHAEIETVLGERLPTFDDLPRLKYTEAVLAESMRLYPPAWIVGRQSVQEYALANYLAPARSIFFMSQYVMQRDARYFHEPARFLPERWTPEMKVALPKFAYFPFGGGPRVCIGESFAWTEGILLIAALSQQWQMRLVPSHPIALQPVITLRPKYGMQMKLERRALVTRR